MRARTALAGIAVVLAGCDRDWVCDADDLDRTAELPASPPANLGAR